MIRCKNIAGVAACMVAMVHAALDPPPYIARMTLPHAPHGLSRPPPHAPHGFVPPACMLAMVHAGNGFKTSPHRCFCTRLCTSIDEIGNWLLEGALILPVRQTFVCCVSGDSCVDCHRSLRLRQSRMGAGCSMLKPVATDEWFLTNFACGLPAHLCGQP